MTGQMVPHHQHLPTASAGVIALISPQTPILATSLLLQTCFFSKRNLKFFFFYSRKNFDLCKEAEQTAAGWSNIHKEESAVCSFIALFVLQPPSRALFPQYNIIAYYITCLSAASPATCWWQWTAPDSQTTSGWDRHWARCLLISRLHICGKKRMLSREIGTRLS